MNVRQPSKCPTAKPSETCHLEAINTCDLKLWDISHFLIKVSIAMSNKDLPVKGHGCPAIPVFNWAQGMLSKLSSKRCQTYCQANPSRLKAMKTKEIVMFAFSGPRVRPACAIVKNHIMPTKVMSSRSGNDSFQTELILHQGI